MRYDAEHKQRTREKVIKEAIRAIRTDGPHRIAVASVMAKAGLTHGGFYAHFDSKEALVASAIEEMFKEAGRRFARVTEGRDPREALIAYLEFYLSKEHRDARSTGCPLTALAADLPRLDAAAQERYGQSAARLTALLADQLQAAGLAEVSASSILAELIGALSLARAVASAEQSDQILASSLSALKRRLDRDQRP